MPRRALVLSVAVAVLFTAACAQEPGLCTDSTGDASHCVCSTPDGVIDVTSLANTDGTPRYSDVWYFTRDNSMYAGIRI